jgi:ATP-dependent DNA helicase RecG
VPSIGTQRAHLFERLGIRRAIDLLFHFPRTYQESSECQSILELKEGLLATVAGTIVDMDSRFSMEGRSSVGALLAVDGGGYVRCVWYNQPFRRENHSIGQRLLARGVIRSSGVAYQMRHPEVTVLEPGESPPPPRPRPVYPLTEGLTQRQVSWAIESILPLAMDIEEALPSELRIKAALLMKLDTDVLPTIQEALLWIHQPNDMTQAQVARSRFIFQELFVLQLALAMYRYACRHAAPAPSIPTNTLIHSRILKRFPFELTEDQKHVIETIRIDMANTIPMNRLLQGDVGTGKTAVAQYALLSAVANQYQAALMAPTELLARQHAAKLKKQLADSRVMIELLVGSIPQAQKREILQRIAIGTVDVVVGTQALLSEHVEFAKLGVIVIDEQHRFGVEQRATLRTARTVPHYLVMTATPIPRTLALTLFGDLDVSTLKQRPPGQSVVKTYVVQPSQHQRWWNFVIKQVQMGRQAYVVVPRVDANDDTESQGAVQWFENLRKGPLKDLRIELLHGKMEGESKQNILDQFANGNFDVLVATTVIEVGIDVPNTSVMTIIDADRFGLAQLHQLRGRVGRGSYPGFVGLFPSQSKAIDPANKPNSNTTATADFDPQAEEIQRLNSFANIHDGFELSQIDLRKRGPGDILGTKQTGLPEFIIADLARDEDVVMIAKEMAAELVESDPPLARPEHAKLLRQVVAKHGKSIAIGDVG